MSRNVSLTTRQALYDQETGESFLLLVTINHDDLPQPIRVSSDEVDTVSRGNTFQKCAFEITLPDDVEERAPRARVRIGNVDRQIVKTIREIQTAPTITIEVVPGSDPDTVEAAFPDFILSDVSYDALVIEGEMSLDELLSEPFPSGRFDPARFPGLF